MDMHVRIELFGGPEDGREITIPVGTEGVPMSPLPVPFSGHDTESAGRTRFEVAWYEQDHYRDRGVWIYKYTTGHSVQQSQTA